ncbi:hypothetical protein FACS1894172_04590 [Spirochaetia bacterium]|nr:hypothetical protein FACS1894164_12630 [Spirochaetia bacterium]GHU30781.1 hypothetical protein FACS1894172_04590 [Spirochaetia bacterium]
MAGDFIPHQDGAFLEWSKTLVTYTVDHMSSFNIQESVLIPIQTRLTAYEKAYTKAAHPNRGKVDVFSKNETRNALKAALRLFIKAYLNYNPVISDTDKEAMGLPLHNTVRTKIPAPSTFPELEVKNPVIRQITVRYKDSKSDKRGKPHGVHGIELRWSFLEYDPASVNELSHSAFSTASPYTFTFNEIDRGKTVYICPRWENNKGEKGPWGIIIKAIVP